jgi:hypothetical protein
MMTTLPEQRVFAMVRAGTITREEGDRLINALQLQPRPARWKMLFNPFDQLSTLALWALAAAVTIGSFAVARMGVRFDGTLDLHSISEATPWPFAALDAASAILVTAIVFWIASLIVARQGRLLDFVLSVSAARLPYVLVGPIISLLLPPPDVILAEATAGIVNFRVLAVSLVILTPGLVWFITWLFGAFKTSSGLKGLRLGMSFTVALITSEIASKIFLYVVSSRI